MEIKDIIGKLSEGERILHKDLIEECFKRENEVNEASKNTKDAIESFKLFSVRLEQLFSALDELSQELEIYYDVVAPEENEYRYLN